MDLDQPPIETAEEKAQRYWHNNRVINVLKLKSEAIHKPQATKEQANTIIKKLNKLRKQIKKLVYSRPNQVIVNYTISIQSTKNRLLREKLRRLEEQSHVKD